MKNAVAMRYFADPTKDGRSIGHASQFSSGMDVHNSSGVYNKAYYLLANTADWDIKKAFSAMVRANQRYWTSSSTFNQGACGVRDAAHDLGYNSYDVDAAFRAVGVSCATANTYPGGGGGDVPNPPTGNQLKNGIATTGISASAGQTKTFTLSVPAGATGLSFKTSGGTGDADLYVKFGSAASTSSFDCKSEGSTNTESCAIATAKAGTYYVTLSAYSAISGVSLTGSHSSGGDTGGGTGSAGQSTTVVAIPDYNSTGISSPISLSGSGTASSATVEVNIQHPYIGDLIVELIAPNGTAYVLHNRAGGSADNLLKSYTVSVGTATIQGTWKLRVRDLGANDIGKLNGWKISLK